VLVPFWMICVIQPLVRCADVHVAAWAATASQRRLNYWQTQTPAEGPASTRWELPSQVHVREAVELEGAAVPQAACVALQPTGKRLSASGAVPPISGTGPPAHAAAGESDDSAVHE
jgi:hypothetical protein